MFSNEWLQGQCIFYSLEDGVSAVEGVLLLLLTLDNLEVEQDSVVLLEGEGAYHDRRAIGTQVHRVFLPEDGRIEHNIAANSYSIHVETLPIGPVGIAEAIPEPNIEPGLVPLAVDTATLLRVMPLNYYPGRRPVDLTWCFLHHTAVKVASVGIQVRVMV